MERRELLSPVAVETQNLTCCSLMNYVAAWECTLMERGMPPVTFCATKIY